jgi:hypothetical protein
MQRLREWQPKNCGLLKHWGIVCLTLALWPASSLPAQLSLPAYDHIVVVVEENESFGRVMGSASAPYINNTLAAGGVSFNNMYAVTHPSQPNYLQLYSGSNQGNFDDAVPTGQPFTTPNLGAALGAANFIGYSEDLPSVGSQVATSGLYARKHAPWANWQGSGTNQLPNSVSRPFFTTNASSQQVPFFGDLGNDPANLNYALLPKVSFVVPNLVNDMHDGSYPTNVATGDAWLQNNLSGYAQWAKTHNSLLVVTFDEVNSSGPNKIPTIFYGANLKNGTTVDGTYTLHNLLRTIEDTYGVAHSGSAANVRPLLTAFAGQPNETLARFQQGINGYANAHDTMVQQDSPGSAFGTAATLTVDTVATAGASQSLVRFDNILGHGVGQIPAGATILSAKLVIQTATNSTVNSVELHRMLRSWDESATWTSLTNGLTADGAEAAVSADFSLIPNLTGNTAIFDVSDTLQRWVNGTETNFGWALLPTGSDGWLLLSSEDTTAANRPYLEVSYIAAIPEPKLFLIAIALVLICWMKLK